MELEMKIAACSPPSLPTAIADLSTNVGAGLLITFTAPDGFGSAGCSSVDPVQQWRSLRSH